jgi:L-ribulokinase
MARVQKKSFRPRKQHHQVYQELFKEYQTLHDYFGRGANDVMKRLKELKRRVASAPH